MMKTDQQISTTNNTTSHIFVIGLKGYLCYSSFLKSKLVSGLLYVLNLNDAVISTLNIHKV